MTPQRTCKKCGTTHPATTEFFPPLKKVKSGLHAWCRECMRAKNREIMRRRYEAEKAGASLDEQDARIPEDRLVEIKRPNGMRGIRFGKAWKPAHPEADTRALRGWECPLTRLF